MLVGPGGNCCVACMKLNFNVDKSAGERIKKTRPRVYSLGIRKNSEQFPMMMCNGTVRAVVRTRAFLNGNRTPRRENMLRKLADKPGQTSMDDFVKKC